MNDVEFASDADDNTPFCVGNDLSDVILKLQYASKTLFKWFKDNHIIRNSSCEKLLGVFFDSKLTFQSHIYNICKKASQKLNAVSRITPYMDFDKKKRISCKCFFHGPIQILPINMDML